MKKDRKELDEAVSVAKSAEGDQNYFMASVRYKEALSLALEAQDSELITLCKNKVVEMNRAAMTSGKDFKEISIELPMSEKARTDHNWFIDKLLGLESLTDILYVLGCHDFFFPKISEVREQANGIIPIAFQIANLSTISNIGHNPRGHNDGQYAWYMKMYSIRQQLILRLYIEPIIKKLMDNESGDFHLNLKQLTEYFTNSNIFDPSNLAIISIGLARYFEKDYVSAIHILIPQFESVFLKLSEKAGIDIVAADQKPSLSTRTKTLSENHLNSPEFQKVWGEDFCQQIKFALFEPMGYKLRHKVAHGEILPEECNFTNSSLILNFYLALISRLKIQQP